MACTRENFDELKSRPRRRGPKPAAAVKPVKAPEVEARESGGQRYRFLHGGYSDVVRIDSGTAKRISDCIERVFGNAPKIGHERQSEAA